MSGLASKRSGAYFENYFFMQCKIQGVNIYKLPSIGAKFINRKRIVKKSIICDFILSFKDSIFLIDTKSTISNISYSTINHRSFFNQIVEMSNLQNNLTKNRTGFVVHFSKLDVISFFNTRILLNLKEKQGLSYKEGLILKDKNEQNLNIRRIFL